MSCGVYFSGGGVRIFGVVQDEEGGDDEQSSELHIRVVLWVHKARCHARLYIGVDWAGDRTL